MRSLVFRAGGRPFAIDVRAVLAVQPARGLGLAPGAPDGVRGVVAWRGEVVTVVTVPGVEPGEEIEPSLVRLAPPRDHLALYVSGEVEIVDHPDPAAASIDPARLG